MPIFARREIAVERFTMLICSSATMAWISGAARARVIRTLRSASAEAGIARPPSAPRGLLAAAYRRVVYFGRDASPRICFVVYYFGLLATLVEE